tara:strand:+ start:22 stop:459 length:438 start_codon:yes stop_codon:yes gene_type:complete
MSTRAILAGSKRAGADGGARGKVPVFGLLKQGRKVHAVVIPNAQSATLFPINQDSIVYSDSFRGYYVLDVSKFHHVRSNYSEAFVEDRNHINGIKNFRNQAKRHLRRFNGVSRQHSPFYLKECEWRFNHRPTKTLLKVLRKWAKV